jgi:hypothetical protein
MRSIRSGFDKCETSLLSNHPNVRRLSFCARSASPSMRERRINGVYDALFKGQVASSMGQRRILVPLSLPIEDLGFEHKCHYAAFGC